MSNKKRRNGSAGDSEFLESNEPETPTDTPSPIPEIASPEIPSETPVNLPEPAQAVMTLRVFAASCGIRWDQMAGFWAHAKAANLESLTMEAWRKEFEKFQNRPM